jgi:uncharacterized iron-regulated membrane protein
MVARGPTSRRRALARFHRSVALTLGLFLVVFTTSGALLLFRPDVQRAMNPRAFQSARLSTDHPVSIAEALHTVQRTQPNFPAGRVWSDGQVYRVYNTAQTHWWSVDPGSGRVLGHDGTPLDGFWGLLKNLHTCMLTCTQYPGYLSPLTATVPGLGVPVSTMVYGLLVLTVLALALSGFRLASAALRSGLRVRWSRAGRLVRHSDLHRVVGVVAAPFLGVWAITGAGFQVPVIDQIWYALTPGAHAAAPAATPAPAGHGPDIGVDAALRGASTLVGPGHPPIFALLPSGGAMLYHFRFEAAPLTYGDTTDGIRVEVDRYRGTARFEDNPPGSPAATVLWENWRYPVHSGIVAHGWWRLPWLAVGIAPLTLAVTGGAAWLFRRRLARERAARRRTRTATQTPVHQRR